MVMGLRAACRSERECEIDLGLHVQEVHCAEWAGYPVVSRFDWEVRTQLFRIDLKDFDPRFIEDDRDLRNHWVHVAQAAHNPSKRDVRRILYTRRHDTAEETRDPEALGDKLVQDRRECWCCKNLKNDEPSIWLVKYFSPLDIALF